MKKRNTVILAVSAAAALSLAFLVLYLYGKTMVATIVNDERLWDLRDASPRETVIISDDGMVARFLGEEEYDYIGGIQDTVRIPKRSSKVETWYASDGKGTVRLKEEGESPAYAEPDSTSSVVGKLIFEYGCCPESYDCLSLMDGWYKVRISDTEGYIREECVCWDAIDSM